MLSNAVVAAAVVYLLLLLLSLFVFCWQDGQFDSQFSLVFSILVFGRRNSTHGH